MFRPIGKPNSGFNCSIRYPSRRTQFWPRPSSFLWSANVQYDFVHSPNTINWINWHLDSKHEHLLGKPLDYFQNCLRSIQGQQTTDRKQADRYFQKAKVGKASYQVAYRVAQCKKKHTQSMSNWYCLQPPICARPCLVMMNVQIGWNRSPCQTQQLLAE